MINNTYDQEGCINLQNLSNPNPTQRGYSGFKNPRIVRVSREYGGKDRHSKVWTVKGVKDRRIRLSVPTAIQLYHLQDQLGLSQPSKVIDWLLDVTKEDVNKLPPLQMALEDFNRFHFPSRFVHQDYNSTQLSYLPFSNPNHDHQRTKGKEVAVQNKLNSYHYNEIQSSSNSSLSIFGHHLNTFPSVLPSSFASSSESQYFMHRHFHFLGSSSQPETYN